jgi:hypothetical protein
MITLGIMLEIPKKKLKHKNREQSEYEYDRSSIVQYMVVDKLVAVDESGLTHLRIKVKQSYCDAITINIEGTGYENDLNEFNNIPKKSEIELHEYNDQILEKKWGWYSRYSHSAVDSTTGIVILEFVNWGLLFFGMLITLSGIMSIVNILFS